jgi:hypothetical protein
MIFTKNGLISKGTVAVSGSIISSETIQSKKMIVDEDLILTKAGSTCVGNDTTKCTISVNPSGKVQITPAGASAEDDVWRVQGKTYTTAPVIKSYF